MTPTELAAKLANFRDEDGYCIICGYHRTQKHIKAVGHSDKCYGWLAMQTIMAQQDRILDLQNTLELINAPDA